MISSIQLEITEDDIKQAEGQAGVYDKCPAALVLTRLGFLKIDVDENRALLTTSEGARLWCKTPRELNLFISQYDEDEQVKPLSCVFTEIREAKPDDERRSQQLEVPVGLLDAMQGDDDDLDGLDAILEDMDDD